VFGSFLEQAESATPEETWALILQNLLELKKNYANAIGSNPEFGSELDALIEIVSAYITKASKTDKYSKILQLITFFLFHEFP
jgi:hypothetical protein